MDRLQSNHPIYDLDWWIEILTALPLCLYYFGSFTTRQEAESLKQGFIEDLFLERFILRLFNVMGSCCFNFLNGFSSFRS